MKSQFIKKLFIVLVTFCLLGLKCHGAEPTNKVNQDVRIFFGDLEREMIYEEVHQMDRGTYINETLLLEAALRMESKTLENGIKGLPNQGYIRSIKVDVESKSVYVDLSEEYPMMNYGSYGEYLAFQSLAYTIGVYYEVERVFLTVENKPYESGHYYLEEGLEVEFISE